MNLAKWMLVAALAAGTAMAEDATKAFEVVKRTPVMAASATDVGEGEDVTVIATLVDAEDATGTVFVYVGGDDYSAAVEDGAANVIVSELAPGYYSATVEYSGDDTYFGVSANVSFKVGRPQEEVDGVVWYYEPLEAGTAVVTGVAPNHATRNLTMPERLGGLTVTAVGGGAFHGCADLRSMAIPDSVTEIGSQAFRECTALTNVTLGAGVTNIGDYAFEGCTSLASVAFPEGLAGIEHGAFLGSALTDAKLPDTTERIGEDVFAGCKALTNVWLGTGIESVGVFAFHLSTNLAAVWVPVEKAGTDLLEEARVPAGCEIHYYGTQTVTFEANGGTCGTRTNAYTIGEAYGALPEATWSLHTFDGWRATNGAAVTAASIVTEEAERTLAARWKNGVVVSNVLWLCETNGAGGATVTGAVPAEGDMVMPESLDGVPVTEVGAGAFGDCTNLTGMAIAGGVTNIGAEAFGGCTRLASAEWPEGLESIGDGAFRDSGLTEAAIPDSVASIGDEAFEGCTGLTNAVLGAGIESVGANAFAGCDALETVWVPVEQEGTGLLDAAGLPAGCEVRYYGTVAVAFDANGGTTGSAWRAEASAEIGSNLSALLGATVPGEVASEVVTAPAGTRFGGYEVAVGGGQPATLAPGDAVDVVVTGAATVKYRWENLYTVTVRNGTTADSPAAAGTVVTVTAGDTPDGQTFTGWSCNVAGVAFADASALQTTFEMPATNATVTAGFATILIEGLDANGYPYTGAAVEPDFRVSLEGTGTTLAAGTDYGVSWTSNVNAGTATVTVTLTNRPAGNQSATFAIRKRGVTLTSASAEKAYDGTALTAGEVTVGGDGFASGEGASFNVTGTRTKVGTSSNVFTYALNAGTKEGNYEIETVCGTLRVTKAALAGAEVTAAGQTYDGTAKEPAPVVTWNGKTLKAGTDYEVSGWTNNVDAGEGTVTVAGKGNFTGTASGTFAIGKRSVTFTGESGEREYNGGEIALTGVEAEGLAAGHGHNAAAEAKGTDAGRHEGTITAAGSVVITAGGDDVTRNYEVTTVAGTLTIVPRDITNAVVAAIGTQTYESAPPTPALAVTDGEPSIITTNDYVVSYSGNGGPGTATATITGTNNYTGTATATFEVRWASETVDGTEWSYRTDLGGGTNATVVGASPAEGELTVPETLGGATVTGIGDGASAGCTNLTGVVFPDGVSSVGEEAFAGCTGLTNAVLGAGIESVGAGAFAGCDALETVWVPIEQQGTGLLDAAGLPDGCEVRYYGTQTVTFDANGGTCATASGEFEIGGAYGELPEGTREGWAFLGWFDEAEDGEEVGAESVVTEAAERTLWAHWEAAHTVWRFFNKAKKAHFFTISEEEAAGLDANPNWTPEGEGWMAFSNQVPGSVAIHRFYSKGYGGHFYTASEEEMERVRDTNPNWTYEGVAHYAYPGEKAGCVPVHRFWSKRYRTHFFTIDEAEKDGLIANNPNWTYEGIGYWAVPTGAGGAKGKAAKGMEAAGPKQVGGEEAGDGEDAEAATRAGRPRPQVSRAGRPRSGTGTAGSGVAVTTSDGTDGSAVFDGDEGTGWSPAGAGPGWVALSFAEPVEVGSVEVIGENLPEGLRVLWSEDAEIWEEEEPMGAARYVWVAWAEGNPAVREIRVEATR